MTANQIASAIRHGQEDAVLAALEAHPELKDTVVDEAYGEGDKWPLLTLAVVFRRKRVWDWLIAHGVDLEKRAEKYAATPLGFAVSCDVPEAVADLRAAGGKDDLWSLAYSGDVAGAREWLQHDPEAVRRRDGADGAMPLHYARGVEMVDLLIDAGADPNVEDSAHTAQPVVWHATRPEMVVRLLERGAVPDLRSAVVLGDLAGVQAAWDKHPDQQHSVTQPHYLGGGGSNLIGIAAVRGHLAVAEWLVGKGVTVNPDGPVSPLHRAAWDDHPEMITLLAKHGADMERLDDWHNSTPIEWAAYAGRPAAIGALLAAGSPVTENALENARLGAQGKLPFSPGTPPAVYEECVALLEKGKAAG
jgi:hypothetical protein